MEFRWEKDIRRKFFVKICTMGDIGTIGDIGTETIFLFKKKRVGVRNFLAKNRDIAFFRRFRQILRYWAGDISPTCIFSIHTFRNIPALYT